KGRIWKGGYASGRLKGDTYSDVPVAMKRWCKSGKRVAIYSSGSREAQRLLFNNIPSGELCSYISTYFDTSVGSKLEEASYREITLSLGVADPSEVLFVTDMLAEAKAAKDAQLEVVLAVRPGNAPLPPVS
ncbi:unnamed protein product, partial [Choristocarpus tenellus]